MKIIFYNIVAISFVALAAFMIWQKSEGWGWAMLCALITQVSVTFKTDETPNK